MDEMTRSLHELGWHCSMKLLQGSHEELGTSHNIFIFCEGWWVWLMTRSWFFLWNRALFGTRSWCHGLYNHQASTLYYSTFLSLHNKTKIENLENHETNRTCRWNELHAGFKTRERDKPRKENKKKTKRAYIEKIKIINSIKIKESTTSVDVITPQ